MKEYFEYLLCTLAIFGYFAIIGGPLLAAFLLALLLDNFWFLFLLLLYIPLIPLYVVLWDKFKESDVSEYFD